MSHIMPNLIRRDQPHYIALENWAKDIWEQYLLGNKSEARIMFAQVPVDRRGYVAFHITTHSMGRTQLMKPYLEEFFRSTVT